MTIKKMISAFCLAAGLVIATPAAASVTGLPQGTAAVSYTHLGTQAQ